MLYSYAALIRRPTKEPNFTLIDGILRANDEDELRLAVDNIVHRDYSKEDKVVSFSCTAHRTVEM